MLKRPFSLSATESIYSYSIYKDAIGDPNVINGTCDDFEMDVVSDGCINVYYDDICVGKIFFECLEYDDINWEDEPRHSFNRAASQVTYYGTAREYDLLDYLEDVMDEVNSYIQMLESDPEHASEYPSPLSEYEAETWEQFFYEVLEFSFDIKKIAVVIKGELLPVFKELKRGRVCHQELVAYYIKDGSVSFIKGGGSIGQ